MAAERKFEDWPLLEQSMHGVSLKSTAWRRVKNDGTNDYSSAKVRLANYTAGVETKDAVDLGSIKISRARRYVSGRNLLARSFRASFMPEGSSVPHHLGVGQCATWEEAIEAVGQGFDIVSIIQSHGFTIYGNRDLWKPVRPFKVRWPWSHPDEPNRQYTEFKLLGDWKLEEGNELVAYQYAATPQSVRELATKVGANAFLAQDDHGKWVVYHRGHMTAYDPIEIEEFYARLIAGSGDDED